MAFLASHRAKISIDIDRMLQPCYLVNKRYSKLSKVEKLKRLLSFIKCRASSNLENDDVHDRCRCKRFAAIPGSIASIVIGGHSAIRFHKDNNRRYHQNATTNHARIHYNNNNNGSVYQNRHNNSKNGDTKERELIDTLMSAKCNDCDHTAAEHLIEYRHSLDDDDIISLLQLVNDSERMERMTTVECDRLAKSVYINLHKLLDTRLYTDSFAPFKHHYESPPFEYPSIDYFLYNFVCYKFKNSSKALFSKMVTCCQYFLSKLNVWSLISRHSKPIASLCDSERYLYRAYYQLWMVYCLVPRYAPSLPTYPMTQIFGLKMLRLIYRSFIDFALYNLKFERTCNGLIKSDFDRFIYHLNREVFSNDNLVKVNYIEESFINVHHLKLYNSPMSKVQFPDVYKISFVLQNGLMMQDFLAELMNGKAKDVDPLSCSSGDDFDDDDSCMEGNLLDIDSDFSNDDNGTQIKPVPIINDEHHRLFTTTTNIKTPTTKTRKLLSVRKDRIINLRHRTIVVNKDASCSSNTNGGSATVVDNHNINNCLNKRKRQSRNNSVNTAHDCNQDNDADDDSDQDSSSNSHHNSLHLRGNNKRPSNNRKRISRKHRNSRNSHLNSDDDDDDDSTLTTTIAIANNDHQTNHQTDSSNNIDSNAGIKLKQLLSPSEAKSLNISNFLTEPALDLYNGIKNNYIYFENIRNTLELRSEARSEATAKLLLLLELQNLITHQLPKMGNEYIARIVFDPRHRSIVLIKNHRVIGGITFRMFKECGFAEIIFCAIMSREQVKGYGTLLMNLLKDYAITEQIYYFLTYADEFAVGYFRKQNFHSEITLKPNRYVGYIKEYEGATLMECKVDPFYNYAQSQIIINCQISLIRRLIERQSAESDEQSQTSTTNNRTLDSNRKSQNTRIQCNENNNSSNGKKISHQEMSRFIDEFEQQRWTYIFADSSRIKRLCKYSISFEEIKKRLKRGYYQNIRLLYYDILRMLRSYQFTYRRNSDFHKCASNLENYLKKSFKDSFDLEEPL